MFPISFLFILCILLVPAQKHIENDYLFASFDETNGRISAINSKTYNQQFTINGDDFNISLNISNKIYVLSSSNTSQNWAINVNSFNNSLIQIQYECEIHSNKFKLTTQYTLQSEWNFISKTIMIESSITQFQIQSISNIFHKITTSTNMTSYHIAIDHMLGGKQIALFVRYENNYGFFQLISNPFTKYSFNQNNNDQICIYNPYEYFTYKQINNSTYYKTDNILFGIYKLTKYQIVTNAEYIKHTFTKNKVWLHPSLKGTILSTNMNPQSINKEYSSSTYTNLAERNLISNIQETFLMDMQIRKNYGAIRINVGWDENDYQLNFGTNTTDINTYNRIFKRNKQYNIKHETMAAYNPLQGQHNRAFLGWEPVLWFSEGENVRLLTWNPIFENNTLPLEIKNIINAADKYNIKLNAYIYPILPLLNPFCNTTDWLFVSNNKSYATLANIEYQNYLMQLLLAFCNATNCGGFNWDMVYFMDPNCMNEYSQYKGWMRVIEYLREIIPNIVMDHRQMNRDYGVWYQLAGSYAEPLARDENPETYGIFIPNLHTDNIAADYMRRQTWIYYQSQYQSVYRIPGFIHHQTERNLPNNSLTWQPIYMRDFDILGSIFSMIANIGYASQNMIFAMIPARDEQEFNKMPETQINFVNYWLNFSNIYINYLKYTKPILSMPTSKPLSVDGTSSINSFQPYNDTGFIFL
eukprot:71424_1